MNIFNEIKESIHSVIRNVFPNVTEASLARMNVEPPRDATHGDMATNAAMILAKEVGLGPKAVAEVLVPHLQTIPHITKVDVAGPGFINLTLKPEAFKAILPHALNAGPATFGNGSIGIGSKVNIEYVSANPTGPLTVGHARGAIFGDAIANLMSKAGFAVRREYYINDAGRQVEVLTDSVVLRIREAAGEDIGEIPAGCYPGEYLKDVAKAYIAKFGPDVSNRQQIRDFAVENLIGEIKTDLAELGVKHDIFISEAAILASGAVEDAISQLEKLGLIYTGILEAPKGKTPDDWEAREQMLFRSTDFGDDVDRPLKKSDGSTTYFANDIAHYFHVHNEGFDTLINVVGADHGGYVKRAKAAVKAISEGKCSLELPLVSIVHVTDNGQPVRMSKRAGTFITLRDMMDHVGAGVMRFIMLTREAGQTLEFDYTKVTEQSKDNPYFYVQYAHARSCSVMKHAATMFEGVDLSDAALAKIDLTPLVRTEEMALVRLIATWQRVVEQAAAAGEPHRIAYFAQELAAGFHGWWNKGREDGTLRFLIEDDKALTFARLALVRGVAVTLASALNVIGVPALQELRSDIEVEVAA